jgi:5-methylcytosine-specific restriction enzyme subunit McrC
MLRAKGVVGIIADSECSIEILPKIEVRSEGSMATGEVRKKLVHMLAAVSDLDIEVGDIADIEWQRDDLLEVLIRVFIRKLSDALRRGMPRSYIVHRDDLPALKGSMDIVRQFSLNAANPSRLACRFDVLSPDVILNRVMKSAVRRLTEVSRNNESQRRLREISFAYADVSDIDISLIRWDDILVDRTNGRWRELLALARLLLQGRYQTTTGGSTAGYSLLFRMSDLFEEYIGRSLQRAVAGSGYQVSLQAGKRYCLTDPETSSSLFQTRPDMIVRKDGEIVRVIDTKWKKLTASVYDTKQGVKQSDVYQMMAYGQLYRTAELTLLYPHHPLLDSEEGQQSRHLVTGTNTMLNISTIDIANTAQLGRRLRELVLGFTY